MLKEVQEIRESYKAEEERIQAECNAASGSEEKYVLYMALTACRDSKYHALLNFFTAYVRKNLSRLTGVPFGSPEADKLIRDVMGEFSVRRDEGAHTENGTEFIIRMYEISMFVTGGAAGDEWTAIAGIPVSSAYSPDEVECEARDAYRHVKGLKNRKNLAEQMLEEVRGDAEIYQRKYHGPLRHMFMNL